MQVGQGGNTMFLNSDRDLFTNALHYITEVINNSNRNRRDGDERGASALFLFRINRDNRSVAMRPRIASRDY